MLGALLCLLAAAPAPINGWLNKNAPNQRLLPFDMSRIDQGKLLRPNGGAAIYALGINAQDYRKTRLPIILVHGYGGEPRDLQPVANRLRRADRQIHVLAYDGRNRRTSLTGVDFANELSALARRLGGKPQVVIVAHSMGGLVSRRALNELQLAPTHWIDAFRRVRLLTIDTPWHGFVGPSDAGFEGWFMNLARPFIPDAAEDMRAKSAMFQGDPNARDAPSRAALLKGPLAANIEVEVVFAQQGNEAMDYTEGGLVQLAPQLAAFFNTGTFVNGDAQLLNFWWALMSARAYTGFKHALQGLADTGLLNEARVRQALLKYYPRFPGDHMGVLQEHRGQRSMLDWLVEKLR